MKKCEICGKPMKGKASVCSEKCRINLVYLAMDLRAIQKAIYWKNSVLGLATKIRRKNKENER